MAKRIFCLAVAILLLALFGVMLFVACTTPNLKSETKAAIVDQLHILQQNQDFIQQTTQELNNSGFAVDVYRGDDVTVDFYRNLPNYGYKLIIFRVHSGLLGVDPKVTNKTWLFTAEPYSKTKHVSEQLTDQVTYAATGDDAWLFAVSAKFIKQSMKAKFDKTVIIMMGCDCFHFTDLAEAFIEKGASTYVAWDFSVLLNYVDSAVPLLIEKLGSEGVTVKQAVDQTMQQMKPDPQYGSVLHYFPEETGSKTISQLIK